MNKLKIITIAVFTLSLLVFGQSYGVTALVDNGNRTSRLGASSFKGEAAFGVDIYFVGTSPTTQGAISMQSDGTYHVVDPNAGEINSFFVKINVTGWTCWGDCTTADPYNVSHDLSDDLLTSGQLFFIVDDIVEIADGQSLLSTAGHQVAVRGTGLHVFTVLYVGKDQANGLVWAADTVKVRIEKSAINTATAGFVSVPLTQAITDSAVAGNNYRANISIEDAYTTDWTRRIFFEPTSDVDVGIDGLYSDNATFYDNDLYIGVGAGTTIDLKGTVNSTGFDTEQNGQDNHTTTVGHHFILDASGIRLLDNSVTSVTLIDNIFTLGNDMQTFSPTYVGVLTLSEYGRHIKDNVTGGIYEAPFADYEGMNSAIDKTNESLRISMDASFDFNAIMDASYLTVTSNNESEVEAWVSSDLGIVDSTSTVRTTIPGDTSVSSTATTTTVPGETSVETVSPGFGVIVSLLTIGVIAFVAPRLRKDN